MRYVDIASQVEQALAFVVLACAVLGSVLLILLLHDFVGRPLVEGPAHPAAVAATALCVTVHELLLGEFD